MQIMITNNTVITMIDGTMYNRSDLSKEQLERIKELVFDYQKEAKDSIKEEILSILDFTRKSILTKIVEKAKSVVGLNKEKEEIEKDIKFLSKDILENPFPELLDKDKDEKFSLKGFENVKMPDEFIRKLIRCKETNEDINKFILFWKNCLANPDSNARQGIFKYIEKQNLIITEKGHFVSYRRLVVSKTNGKIDKELKDFVDSEILRIKKQKGSTTKYSVIDTGEQKRFILLDHRTKAYENRDIKKDLGTLKDLNESLSVEEETVYTDGHTQTMKIKLGYPVSIPRSECDSDPNTECSRGLHVGTPSFVSKNFGFGQEIVACLVNPRDVVSVPYGDAHKMRVCRYYPFLRIVNSADLKSFENKDILVFEEEYCDYEIQELESILNNKIFNKKEVYTSEKTKELQDRLNSIKSKSKEEKELLDSYRNKLSVSNNSLTDEQTLSLIREKINSRVKDGKRK